MAGTGKRQGAGEAEAGSSRREEEGHARGCSLATPELSTLYFVQIAKSVSPFL